MLQRFQSKIAQYQRHRKKQCSEYQVKREDPQIEAQQLGGCSGVDEVLAALADGIVESILVLEGEPIKAGQVVARMVADDARLAAAKAEAEQLFARWEELETRKEGG